MNDYRDIFRQLGKRGIFGFPLLIIGVAMLFFGLNSGSRIIGAISAFMGGMVILMGAAFLGNPLARLIAEPTRNLFFPNKHHDRAQPNYALLDALRKKKKYGAAMDGYRRIIREFPQAGRAYIEMIDIAIHHLQEPERAERIYRSGLDMLEDPKDRQGLEQMWEALKDGRTPERPLPESGPAPEQTAPDNYGLKI